ncbi:hypothetical protein KY358_06010 [Candidatus Woesearchaeota archaeon]|nr:hypothetical protein [Candidatus Woesearchaeota archaeon]
MARCPYCKGEVTLKNIKIEKRGMGFIAQERLYSCPSCKSVLGVSRGKGPG